MRAHSEILCIFQKAKQILKELYFAQELHFPPPSFPRIKYINKKKKKNAVFLVKVATTCCHCKGRKVIYDNCPKHVSSSPYFGVRKGRKLFQSEIQWSSSSPDSDMSAQFTFLSSIKGWVQPPSFICIHLQKQSRLTEAASACVLLLNGEKMRSLIHSSVHVYPKAVLHQNILD